MTKLVKLCDLCPKEVNGNALRAVSDGATFLTFVQRDIEYNELQIKAQEGATGHGIDVCSLACATLLLSKFVRKENILNAKG